jgi:hypothetical protein
MSSAVYTDVTSSRATSLPSSEAGVSKILPVLLGMCWSPSERSCFFASVTGRIHHVCIRHVSLAVSSNIPSLSRFGLCYMSALRRRSVIVHDAALEFKPPRALKSA